MARISVAMLAIWWTCCLEAAAAETQTVEWNGYWRAGFNTDSSLFGEPRSTQGEDSNFYDIPTSRHANSPSYLWTAVKKTLENGSAVSVRLDQGGRFPHDESSVWNDAGANRIRLRDLKLEVPIADDSMIWAGSKTIEYEDVRVLDVLSPFNLNVFGGGVHSGRHDFVLSTSRDVIDLNAAGPEQNSDGTTNENKNEVTQRSLTLHYRGVYEISSTSAVKPMVSVTKKGSVAKDVTSTDPTTRDVRDNYSYIIGGVYSNWNDASWSNITFWIRSTPTDPLGDIKDQDLQIGLSQSASHDFGSWGLLYGLWAAREQFANDRQVYKIEDDALVADGTDTTKATDKLSLAVQPVYYISDKVHLALDLNQTYKSVKVSNNDFQSTLITPIVRYSPDRSTIGVPQLYTSVTYGSYDWKAKRDVEGQATSSLITTQTGFELWF